MSSDADTTELEGAMLALVARESALTAYQIKEWFRNSPSNYWSGSAGAIYPAMKRMQAAGWVSASDESKTKRPKKVFRLTDQGRRILSAWISNADRAADAGYDPLRTRLAFIHEMPRKEARAFLEEVLERQLALPPPSSSPHTQALHQSWLDMRERWIREWMDRLG